jgi:thioredoxin 1
MEAVNHMAPSVVASGKKRLDIDISEGIVLALFWAPWCRPCKLQKPIVDILASVYNDRVSFVEINIDQRPEVANRFGVQSIPTLILFKNKSEIKRFIGLQDKSQLPTIIAIMDRIV